MEETTPEAATAGDPRSHAEEAAAREARGLTDAEIQALRDAIEAEDADALRAAAEDLHAADLADFIEQINADERRAFVRLLGDAFDAEILTELEQGALDELIDAIAPEQLADTLTELDSDDLVYLVDSMEPEAQSRALEALEPVDRAALAQALSYPDYSAGRLMQREMVWAPPFMTVGEIIDQMRARDDLPTHFYVVIVVDPAFRPVGLTPLSRILAAPRETRLDAIMDADFRQVRVDEQQEAVAYLFNKYHLVSAPVVEASGRLAGVITIDDAMAALSDEAEEDLLLLGGVGDESLAESVSIIARRRFPWLGVNLFTAILASIVIGFFDAAIEQVVALAVLMPIVASMGGNAGTQTLTVAVRALATKNLTRTNAMRIIARETLVGLVNGVGFAVVVGVVGYLWFADATLGLVLGAAMIINMLAAGLAGILIPIWLERAGADPALSSAVFVTTVTDIVGFFAFLGLAALVLL